MATKPTKSTIGKRTIGRRPSSVKSKPKMVSKIRASKAQVYGTLEQWFSIRKSILERDGYRCTRCGSAKDLEVHHTMPASRGGGTIKLYLTTLCDTCHGKMPHHNHLR